MTTFGKSASLWHAFSALEEQNKSGEVLQSQLKVLTHNIAMCLGIFDGHQIFDDDFHKWTSGDRVDFTSYLSFLKRSLFVRVPDSPDVGNAIAAALFRIDEVCWFVCAPFYLNGRVASSVATSGGTRQLLGEENAFKLWRVFNALAEEDSSSAMTDDDAEVLIPLRVDWEEVLSLVKSINRLVGGGSAFNKDSWRAQLEPMKSFSFVQLIELMETKCLKETNWTLTTTIINELYEENVVGVLKKGYLNKKGGPHNLLWQERWFILTPTGLVYYTNRDETEKKGEIFITNTTTIEDVSDSMMSKQNRIVVRVPTRDYELSAGDSRTKSEWISALRNAAKIQNAATTALTKSEIKQRRNSRFARREKLSDVQKKQLLEKEEKENALRQLEAEKQKRAELEATWKEEELRRQREREGIEAELEKATQECRDAMAKYVEKDSQYEMEKARLAELEEIQRTLQMLLDNERKARDAETSARNMQDKALREELEKKKQLEEMQAAMEKMLLVEQHKREGLEEAKHHQEMMLLEEKRLLRELENERCLRNKEYEDALARLHQAEQEKEDMKKQLEKKKVFLSKFTGDEPIFAIASHRGVDPGAKAGFKRLPMEKDANSETRDETDAAALTSPDSEHVTD